MLNFLSRNNHKDKVWNDIEYFDDNWKHRIQKLSEYIEKDSKIVCDIGCGEQWLKLYLNEGIKYLPVDYKKRTPEVIQCDLNNFELPSVEHLSDVVFCSGVIEYLNDVEWFVKSLNKSKKVIISYCTLEKFPNLKMREKFTWKNHFSLFEILQIFLKYDFILTKLDVINKNTAFCFINKRFC